MKGRFVNSSFNEKRETSDSEHVAVGLPRDDVLRLLGEPDRSSQSGNCLEYLNKRGHLKIGMTFKNGKVDSIYGRLRGEILPKSGQLGRSRHI